MQHPPFLRRPQRHRLRRLCHSHAPCVLSCGFGGIDVGVTGACGGGQSADRRRCRPRVHRRHRLHRAHVGVRALGAGVRASSHRVRCARLVHSLALAPSVRTCRWRRCHLEAQSVAVGGGGGGGGWCGWCGCRRGGLSFRCCCGLCSLLVWAHIAQSGRRRRRRGWRRGRNEGTLNGATLLPLRNRLSPATGSGVLWAGAELNVQTTTGATPLIMACDLSNPEQDLGVAKALVNPARPPAPLPATHGPTQSNH